MQSGLRRSVDTHSFAMVPRADIPRASFNMEHMHKTTFDAGFLVPVYLEEALPGDTFRVKMTAFGRLATPIFPLMDSLYLESFFFFVPNRLVWTNWAKFMGQQDAPGDSISFTIPQIVSPVGGHAVGTLYDYFGLPTVGQVGGSNTVTHSALPIRAYGLIFNQWFRDQNIISPSTVATGDGPDPQSNVALRRRGKRHDYFTSALPWPQKGNTSVSIPLGTTAPVITSSSLTALSGTPSPVRWKISTTGLAPANNFAYHGRDSASGAGVLAVSTTATAGTNNDGIYPTNLFADLSAATAATINQLRQSFQIQRLLERDARGGTRYTEIVRSHFGVISPDARLDRPEYLGGGRSSMVVNPIVQNSATGLTGGTAPLGTLSGVGTTMGTHGFSQSFTEHGYVIGLVNVRAELSYQQGMRRHWSRATRYDFYFPAFANLGEQSVLTKEIFADGSITDNTIFGYQERWAEYRYIPSHITGLFRSTSAGTLDAWHLAQRFTVAPVLDTTFMNENPPLSRVLAVGAAANGAQIIFDSFFQSKVTRPMPLYSVPGLIDHF